MLEMVVGPEVVRLLGRRRLAGETCQPAWAAQICPSHQPRVQVVQLNLRHRIARPHLVPQDCRRARGLALQSAGLPLGPAWPRVFDRAWRALGAQLLGGPRRERPNALSLVAQACQQANPSAQLTCSETQRQCRGACAPTAPGPALEGRRLGLPFRIAASRPVALLRCFGYAFDR